MIKMSWKNILKKIITPREFLQSIQEKTGGEITDAAGFRTGRFGYTKNKIDMTLSHDAGYVKIKQRGLGEFAININGKEFLTTYNLDKDLPKVLEMVGK
tara:strand:+ start:849 stop:1145 length:297 start_codon:yes stop_codon:yes gene_type:complete